MNKTNFSLLNILSCATKIIIVLLMTASVCYGMSTLDLANNAETFLDNMQYDEAIEYYTRTLEVGVLSLNNLAIVYYKRGNAYAARHQYDRAIGDFNRAIELNPKDADAYYNKACLYSLTNKTDEACSLLKQSISNGYDNWNYIKSDSDFDNIRNSSCYKKIMSGR